MPPSPRTPKRAQWTRRSAGLSSLLHTIKPHAHATHPSAPGNGRPPRRASSASAWASTASAVSADILVQETPGPRPCGGRRRRARLPFLSVSGSASADRRPAPTSGCSPPRRPRASARAARAARASALLARRTRAVEGSATPRSPLRPCASGRRRRRGRARRPLAHLDPAATRPSSIKKKTWPRPAAVCIGRQSAASATTGLATTSPRCARACRACPSSRPRRRALAQSV